jgi:hypothetical protein
VSRRSVRDVAGDVWTWVLLPFQFLGLLIMAGAAILTGVGIVGTIGFIVFTFLRLAYWNVASPVFAGIITAAIAAGAGFAGYRVGVWRTERDQ